ncbi:MAG TPA: inositol monophosphatase [Saprospiraceae bacterium]|nr:inositol monophosphatase [Saprospiraceae bacterium]
MDLIEINQKVKAIIRQAGNYIKQERGKVKAHHITDKSLNNLVSYVDKTAELLLVKNLKEILPQAGFLTEEKTVAQDDKPLRWIIDPLDGTTNFLFGLPIYSVSIALTQDEEILIGAIFIPELDELFSATKNGGAFLNDRPIKVSRTQTIDTSLAATGFPYFKFEYMDFYMSLLEKYIRSTRGVRRLGSAAVDLAYVACGRFDFYFEMELNPWDIAAGLLIVAEAGGQTSNFDGTGSAFSGKEILASNKTLHHLLLEKPTKKRIQAK